ncbi:MAG: class I SAM-dependent methyltransferase [Gammaproteobacteria bacterium]|nr:class I SAM-dependent methyltransferase [Gammaproteobacteria bacterium]
MSSPLTCRACGEPLEVSFADLGMSPLSNAYLREQDLGRMEAFFPLHARVCSHCLLVQVEELVAPADIFGDYSYFSSYSESWLTHCRDYAATVIERLGLDGGSLVLELASNDGYLLESFRAAGIPCLGVEPAVNVAAVARARGIETVSAFFGTDLARRLAAERGRARLVIANNVLAHVPDLNDFVAGIGLVLAPGGTATLEFPHLLRLIEGNQFDTIYHEHFSYFSLLTVRTVFEHHGLQVYHVEELPTHGGSLRLYVCHRDDAGHPESVAVARVMASERVFGLHQLDVYRAFAERVKRTKRDILAFLIEARNEGRRIAAYGAPAKGNTLLNYCGIRTDFIDFTVDRSPHKQGRYLPGTHIPVHAPEVIARERPDDLFILPWNLRDEIIDQMGFIRDWGGRFVVPIPTPEVVA